MTDQQTDSPNPGIRVPNLESEGSLEYRNNVTSAPMGLSRWSNGGVIGDVLQEGCTLLLKRSDLGGEPAVMVYGLYTLLSYDRSSGLVAIRRWYKPFGPGTADGAAFSDEIIPMAFITSILRPTQAQVDEFFTVVCATCGGTGESGALHQPCQDCDGKGNTQIRSAPRLNRPVTINSR